MKCEKCGYPLSMVSDYEYSMKRLYISLNKKRKAIGWICPYCQDVKLESNWKKLLNKKIDKILYVRWQAGYKKIGKLWYDKKVQFVKNLKIKPKSKHRSRREHF